MLHIKLIIKCNSGIANKVAETTQTVDSKINNHVNKRIVKKPSSILTKNKRDSNEFLLSNSKNFIKHKFQNQLFNYIQLDRNERYLCIGMQKAFHKKLK